MDVPGVGPSLPAAFHRLLRLALRHLQTRLHRLLSPHASDDLLCLLTVRIITERQKDNSFRGFSDACAHACCLYDVDVIFHARMNSWIKEGFLVCNYFNEKFVNQAIKVSVLSLAEW